MALTPRRQRHGLGRRWSEAELARLPLIAMPRGNGPALAREMLGLIGRHARALGRLAGQA